jgi:hypothetical protein
MKASMNATLGDTNDMKKTVQLPDAWRERILMNGLL